MNMYPMASVVTSESRDVPIVAPPKRSAESDALVLLAASFSPLAFTFNISPTSILFSWPSDVRFVSALNTFFNVIFAKEKAVSVSGMTVDNTGPLAEEKSHDI